MYAAESPVRRFYWTGGKRPVYFEDRPRRTELCARTTAKPHSAFKCFSAANVGTGSLAGMRSLHRAGRVASVWPFAAPAHTTIVEIYPRFLVAASGQKPNQLHHHPDRIDRVLRFFGARSYVGADLNTEDKADAVVSSAALRYFSARAQTWRAPVLEPAAQREGWIFGVESAKPCAP